MTPESLVEAFARGLASALLDVQATAHPREAPQQTAAPSSEPSDPAAVPVVTPGNLPLPGFDPASEELPLIPPATLRDMEKAMEAITRGHAVPPGMYEPEDAVTRVPLS